MTEKHKRLLTVKDLASYLQVSQTTIYRLVRRAQIPAFKVAGDWRFNIESVDEWRLRADSASSGRRTWSPGRLASRRPNPDSQLTPFSELLPLPVTETPDLTAVLERIYEAISQMLGPVTEISRKLPALKIIAEAIEDRRDTSDEIARLYEGETIAFRSYSENLLKFVPSAFGVVDRDHNLVSFNDSYCQLFGFRRKQLRTVRLPDLVHSDDLESLMDLNALLWLGNTEFVRSVARRLTGTGKAMPTKSTAWPIRPTPTAEPKYIAASLERLADQDEAAALFTQSADQLSKHRGNFLKPR